MKHNERKWKIKGEKKGWFIDELRGKEKEEW
jgi:hypothetical protein